jgi:predicted CXXCH cytochrome family protein
MLRKLFIWGNVLLLVVFVAAMVQDLAGPYFPKRWANTQLKYRKMQADAEADEAARKTIEKRPVEIKQILVKPLELVDRCTSCHQGMDSLATPTLQNTFTENPFKSHPGDFLKNHPPEKFGCVSCHGGQGLATTFNGAGHTPKDEAQKAEWHKKHSWEPAEHWDRPMLAPPYIQASCAKCHGNHATLSGAEVVSKGKELMAKHGCFGCHQWKGFGGPISVDLAEETANKPLGRIDFSHAGLNKEDRTLLNWIRLHFVMDPWKLTPGDPEAKHNREPIAPSGMVNYTEPSLAHPNAGPELSEDDATALTAYILSAQEQKMPHNYYVPGPKDPKFTDLRFNSRREAGKWVFDRYGCAGCHGLNAKGGRKNFNYQGDGYIPTLVKTVGNFTRDELREKIEKGVPVVAKEKMEGPTPPLFMPAWKDRISHEEIEVLMDYLFSIAEKVEEF